jgi:hypothetical protein
MRGLWHERRRVPISVGFREEVPEGRGGLKHRKDERSNRLQHQQRAAPEWREFAKNKSDVVSGVYSATNDLDLF